MGTVKTLSNPSEPGHTEQTLGLATGSGSQRPSTMPGILSLFLNCGGVQEVPGGELGHQAALRELEAVAVYQRITPVVQSFHQQC